ncbi:hypothetical protein K458DRAFT_392680 [Lentithecium fluviatile CBS 122367]|uniref:Uncharacterized protein n=1 Tax=Lentithecium fluviatile CBS 122367 TaxID=1168545 RepID=A0A6G1IQV9_9PLEO|nr:hypothetical protein K458DRAFT_392680 [Lentithecium fluviatile CBS 122367]
MPTTNSSQSSSPALSTIEDPTLYQDLADITYPDDTGPKATGPEAAGPELHSSNALSRPSSPSQDAPLASCLGKKRSRSPAVDDSENERPSRKQKIWDVSSRLNDLEHRVGALERSKTRSLHAFATYSARENGFIQENTKSLGQDVVLERIKKVEQWHTMLSEFLVEFMAVST